MRNSPFSDQLLRSERNLNAQSMEQLQEIEADGKIRIALLADSHQNYKDLDQVVDHINSTPELDFIVNLGDFTNGGYNLEYDQFLESYVRFQKPAFNTMGNHDALGAGPNLFEAAFGPANYWFESPSFRFVFFHSANLENPEGFDSKWLNSTVKSSSKPVIVFSHIHIRDQTRFQGQDRIRFTSVVLSSKTSALFFGHGHKYEYWNERNVWMLQCPRVEGLQWVLIEIQGTSLKSIHMPTGNEVWAQLKNNSSASY